MGWSFLYLITALISPVEYQRNHVGAGDGPCLTTVGAPAGGGSSTPPVAGNNQSSSLPAGPQTGSRRPSRIPQPSRLPQPLRHQPGADGEGPNKTLGKKC